MTYGEFGEGLPGPGNLSEKLDPMGWRVKPMDENEYARVVISGMRDMWRPSVAGRALEPLRPGPGEHRVILGRRDYASESPYVDLIKQAYQTDVTTIPDMGEPNPGRLVMASRLPTADELQEFLNRNSYIASGRPDWSRYGDTPYVALSGDDSAGIVRLGMMRARERTRTEVRHELPVIIVRRYPGRLAHGSETR